MGTFKWNPLDYSANSQAQFKFALELISKLKLKGNESLLDIGCGDGKITAQLASHLKNGRITGVDSSSEMIAFAREHFPAKDYTNLSFVLADAAELQFREEFDIAFSNAALHWIPGSHLGILKCVRNALKSGGRIFFQMGGEGNADDILSIGDKLIKTEKWNFYFKDFIFKYNFPSDLDYRRWLNEAGLKTISVELLPRDMEQDGVEGLSAWIRTTWLPYLQRLPDAFKKDFIADIAECYIDKFPLDSAGKAHVNMIRLQVEACKSN